jgi:CRISPR type III-associated protein (TIGR04423 family)
MESNKMKTIELTENNLSANYEGYLWWSDQAAPTVLKNGPVKELPNGNNPFIVEGQLFDKANNKSYSIRFVDGDYLIHCFDLNELEKLEYIEKKYLPNRFPDSIKKLCFKEFWRPVEDKLCEGMEVLQPAETVFVGFNSKEE